MGLIIFDTSLVVQKFWLDKMFDENKTWEMRSTRTNKRGYIGLIEAGSGLIKGYSKLTGCASEPITDYSLHLDKHHVTDFSLLKKWKWAWHLENSNRLTTPIEYSHPKGAVIWVKHSKIKV